MADEDNEIVYVKPVQDDEVCIPQEVSESSQCRPSRWKNKIVSAEDQYQVSPILESEPHIVLLGDSTLDNARYLRASEGGRSVESQLLQRCEEHGWELTVLAQDGSTLEDVALRQVPEVPDSATHIIISASGNDLLALLNEMANASFSPAAMYATIGAGLQEVADRYKRLLQALKSSGAHLACCTVYRPNFDHVFLRSLAAMSLGLHNSRILQTSSELDISVLDLASMSDCNEDFINPLELSTRGGSKVIENVIAFVMDHPVSTIPRHFVDFRRTPQNSSFDVLSDIFGIGCCTSLRAVRKVYASKEVSKEVLQAEQKLAMDAESREEAEGPRSFSMAQERWRKS